MTGDGTKRTCPGCQCPEQWVGLACGFCNALVPPEDTALAPDGTLAKVEEIIGWRAWKLNEDGLLISPIQPWCVWQPGEWLTATCALAPGKLRPDHPAYHGPDAADPAQWSPVKECNAPHHGCGFYAGRTKAHLIGLGGYAQGDGAVIGQVQMAGKIIPATNGWRAQKVRPRAIYVPHEKWRLLDTLKAHYGPHGVDVELATTIVLDEAEIPEWCQKCKARMKGRSATCGFCGHNHK